MAEMISKIQQKHSKLNITFLEILDKLKKFETEARLALTKYESELKIDSVQLETEIEDKDRRITELTTQMNSALINKMEADRELNNLLKVKELLKSRIDDNSQKVLILRNQLSREINDGVNTLKLKDKELEDEKSKVRELKKQLKSLKLNYSKFVQKYTTIESREKEISKNYQLTLERLNSYERLLKEYKLNIDKYNTEKIVIEKSLVIREEKFKKISQKYAILEEELLKKDTINIQLEAKLKKITDNVKLNRWKLPNQKH